MRSSVLLASAIFAARSVIAIAQGSAPEPWPQMVSRMEQAALDGVSKELRSFRADFMRRLSSPSPTPDEVALRYAAAYIAWRMANLPDVPKSERSDLLADAVAQLQQVVTRNPNDAEAHALLGSVYGLQIAASPMIRGMTLGPRASAALSRAADIDAQNPRVLLLQGVSAFNTPAMFGGGKDEAERLLRRSLDRFGVEPADKPWPNWGRFDAHVWLGQAMVDKGDRTGARAEYDKARLLAPNSGWLRYVLLPALDGRK